MEELDSMLSIVLLLLINYRGSIPEAWQRKPQNLEVWPVHCGGGDVLGQNLSWICITEELAYFVRFCVVEKVGGSLDLRSESCAMT